MGIRASGVAVFVLGKEGEDGEYTEERVNVQASSIEIEEGEVNERGMGPEIGYTASAYAFDKAGNEYEIEWMVYEYPIGVLNLVEGPKHSDDLELESDVTFHAYS